MILKGWFRLHRRIWAYHPILDGDRFSRREAWLYIVGEAAFDDVKKRFGSETVTLGRGELLVSVRDMAVAWKWGRTKVSEFLQQLQRVEMLTQKGRTPNGTPKRTPKRTPFGTIYLVVNYDTYNPPAGSLTDTKADRRADSNRTTLEEVKNTTNTVSKDTDENVVVENPKTEEKAARGLFAQLVRTYLWMSYSPPSDDWTMGRDMSIRDSMIARGEDSETINEVIRRYRGDQTTMRRWYAKDFRQTWEVDKGDWHKSQIPVKSPKAMSSVGDVLSEMEGQV